MEKIKRLKKKFSKYDLDGYLIPKNDEFFSEYTSERNNLLKHVSNFTGSWGLALILKNKNYLFVDGRYSIQAMNQSGKNFKIITISNFKKKIKLNFKNKKIGFDPKLFNKVSIKNLAKILQSNLTPIYANLFTELKKGNYKVNKKEDQFYFLKDSVTGKSYKKKLKDQILYLRKKNLDCMLVTSSENIGWLLNIRGNDSNYSPIPHSYFFVDTNMNSFLFCDLDKVNNFLKKKLGSIKILNINLIGNFLEKIKSKNFLIDKLTCSIFYENIIRKNNKIMQFNDPIYYAKSIKNKTEINNIKKVHELDGAALTKFLFWVQKNFKKKKITELNAQNKLLSFKKKFKKFKSLSFPTISSTGSNGAIVHYNATNKTNKILKEGNLYLVDSGGQYYFGTTDVTRTISLNTKNKRIKEIFTRVLKGHLNLCNYKISKKTTGSDLDKIARKSLKEIKLDYAHGTGHGVGYFLNVHEGPQSISHINKIKLKNGMILSNEPGFYEKDKFGLRIENLIYIKKNKGRLKFENLTYAPIDKSLILKEMLQDKEVRWLNLYHQNVYKKLKKFMRKKDLTQLKKSCSKI